MQGEIDKILHLDNKMGNMAKFPLLEGGVSAYEVPLTEDDGSMDIPRGDD